MLENGAENGAVRSVNTEAGIQLPNAGFEEWQKSGKAWYPYASGGTEFWGTGNPGATSLGDKFNLTTGEADPRPGSSGTTCAKLQTQFPNMAGIGKLAAGNIFVGSFGAVSGMGGTVNMGRPFTFNAKPTGLRVWYKCNVGSGDKGRIFVCLIRMTKAGATCHVVNTNDADETAFSPSDEFLYTKKSNASTLEGHILGYGDLMIESSVAQWTEVTIPINYREQYNSEKPNVLMVTASASYRGDYFEGSTDSNLFLDDVEGGIFTLILLCLSCPGRMLAQESPASAPAAYETADRISGQPLKKERGLISLSNTFVPKGQWVAGMTASFSTHSNKDYTFVVIEGINSEGHTVKIAPVLAYAVANNMALGARFTYSRTYLRIDSGSIQLGDDDTGIDLKADSYYSLKHVYEGALIWRQYIPLGNNKRFALFNEMQFAIGGSQAKFASGSPVKGTYETGLLLSLGISPGLVAFATNNMAFEVNVGVMGISYSSIKQVHNQVTVGKRSSSMMNFKVNIFSIGLGVAFYL